MSKKLIVLQVFIIFFTLGMTLASYAAPQKMPAKTTPKEQPKTGGTLIFGIGRALANPNPFVATMSTDAFIKETAYESLLTQDDDGKIIPNLAESYEISGGGTVFTLYLRKGVKFHNGKEMKANDVIWSANYVKDPKNSAFGQNIIKDVVSVEKSGDYTVVFTLSKPSVTFLSCLATIRMLPVVPENSLQTGQIKLGKNAFVPGTGPFIFEEYQPGMDMVERKYSDYWGKPAYLDKLIFRPIPDGANRFNALRTGDVHMADRLAALDITRVRKGEVKGIKILEEPFGGFQHIIFNYLSPQFQKPEMRQAIAYAIDKKRLLDEAFFGAGTPTDIMIAPNSIWTKAASIPPHKRDLAKVKALLKAAGYNGQELSVIGARQETELLDSLQRMLTEAGLKVKLEILEAGLVNERLRLGKYDFHSGGVNMEADPVLTMVPYYYTNKVEKAQYSSPRVDQLLDNLDREFDGKKRLQIFKELAWAIHDDAASIPMFFTARYVGMVEKVQGMEARKATAYRPSGRYFKQAWLK